MKLKIIGDGAFGSFLKECLDKSFELSDDAEMVILAVPLSAYEECARRHPTQHLVNVCSVQKPSTDILLKFTDKVTSLHPLFGRRTPADKRNCILSHLASRDNDTWFSQSGLEHDFLRYFAIGTQSSIFSHDQNNKLWTPESHDILMAKTHLVASVCAAQAKVLVDRANDIPDCFLPHSFRLLKGFVQTLDDMPKGTMESIQANPYL